MNREFKRRMKREQRQQERAQMRGGQRPPIPVQQQKRQRVKIRTYFSEIRGELRRVIWPTRQEVITYSMVVILVVTVLTGVVFALDLGFAQGIVELFRPSGP
jgi:preprotein translocase subunit SecE